MRAHAPAVYRLFAEDGTLLYIGRTEDIVTRLRQHLSTTLPAGSRVAGWETIHARYCHHTLVTYATLAEATAAEAAAIRAERPLCNVIHNTGSDWRPRKKRVRTVVLSEPGDTPFTRLAYHLGRAMLDAGHTTDSLAEAAGVPAVRFDRALRHGNPNLDDLAAVAGVLGVRASELLARAEQVAP